MCPSFCRRSNSTVTLGCRLIGTRRPFRCFAVTFWRNSDFTKWVFEMPILETGCGNCDATVSFFTCRIISIVNTFTPFCLLLYHCQARAAEKVSFSLSMISLCSSSTTVKQSSSQVRSLCVSSIFICHKTGEGARTPCKELYHRKTYFLSVKSSVLFKLHQSEKSFLSYVDWLNLNKELDFTERKSVFLW